MYSSQSLKSLLALGLLIVSTSIFAVTPAEEEEKKCIKPKFRDFAPATQSEVAPGSDISFHVSYNADPTKIGADAKGQKLPVNIKDRKTFYEVKSQLPKDLVNTYVRINTHAKAQEGECIGQDGWLLKVKAQEGEAGNNVTESVVAH